MLTTIGASVAVWLLHLAAEQAYRGHAQVQMIFLTSETMVPISILVKKLETRRQKVQNIVQSIRSVSPPVTTLRIRDASLIISHDRCADRLRQQREIDEAIADAMPGIPPAMLTRVAQESDQFEVAAVSETDQRVVRGAVGGRAAALHRKAERAEMGDGLFEILHADHDVVE
jgi:hypothetical protein